MAGVHPQRPRSRGIFGFILFQWVCLATEDVKPCLEGLGYAEEGSVAPFL